MARVSGDVDARIRAQARNRCGYCLGHQDYVLARLHIDHIIPQSHGGNSDESNLWLSCPLCNGHKSDKVTALDPETGVVAPIFNPRTQQWQHHFRWADDGVHIIGLTPIGRGTIAALHLNDDPIALTVRRNWVRAGWHPPED